VTPCLHEPPPLGSPLAEPPPPATAPRATAPAHSTHHHPCTAGVRKHPLTAPLPSRCTQRTTEVQRRQLRHPSETRCQQRCPSCADRIACTHRRPSARPSQNPHRPLLPRAQLPQPTARSIVSARPAFASTHSQRSWPPMHAAYHRGPATSASSSLRDSVPATLPQHLRYDSLHAPPPLGPPLANPLHPLQPCAQPPQPAARSIIHAQPAFTSTRSKRSGPPMHAAYHRGSATSAAPSLRGSVPATLPQLLRYDCLHALPPLDSSLANPPPAAALRTTAPAQVTQHYPMHSRRSQAIAHSAAGRRCTQRTTEVQRRQLRHP
jgi:hypothetical protein